MRTTSSTTLRSRSGMASQSMYAASVEPGPLPTSWNLSAPSSAVSRRAEQLVGDDERADRVVARAAAGVADHVRVAFAQPGVLRRIEPSVHAGEDCELPSGRHAELALRAERRGVLLVGGKDFVENGHHMLSLPRVKASGLSLRSFTSESYFNVQSLGHN
jgi:hypothetical protein